LLQNCRPQIFVGNDPELFSRGELQKPRDGLLDHRLLAVKREQLLGALLPA
jgi:hypothetical protein